MIDLALDRTPMFIGVDLSSRDDMTVEVVRDRHGVRGSGRTSRQLAALPRGGIYLVAHAAMASHCRNLLVDAGRRHDDLIFVTPATVERELLGRRRTPWDVDHAYAEIAGPAGRYALTLIRAYLPG